MRKLFPATVILAAVHFTSLLAPAATIGTPVTGFGVVTVNIATIGTSTFTVNETISAMQTMNNSGFSYAVNSSSGSTSYLVTLNVLNSTGQTWGGFRIGSGNFNNATGFYDIPNPTLISSIDLGVAPTPLSPSTSTSAFLEWTGLNIPTGTTAAFTFQLVTCPNCSGVNLLGTQPTATPEPATFGLLAAALAPIIWLGRRKRAQI